MNMKIIILGAGGIGSLVGALLSKDNDVLLIGRKTHADTINKNGLEVSGSINENFKVKASTEVEEIEDNTLIILSTKVVDSEESINNIKNKIKKNNVILCLQNGLGSEDIVKNIVDCAVIRGIITAGTTFLEPGKIVCSNIGNIYIEKSDFSEKISEIFNNSNLLTEIDENIKDRIWKKLIANCVMNALTGIFKVKNGDLEKSPELVESVIHELVLVANREGLNYDETETFNTVTKIIKASAENKSSMFQDILKGRKTEIDFLNGKVVKLAEKHKINVPVNKTLISMIKFLEGYDATKN